MDSTTEDYGDDIVNPRPLQHRVFTQIEFPSDYPPCISAFCRAGIARGWALRPSKSHHEWAEGSSLFTLDKDGLQTEFASTSTHDINEHFASAVSMFGGGVRMFKGPLALQVVWRQSSAVLLEIDWDAELDIWDNRYVVPDFSLFSTELDAILREMRCIVRCCIWWHGRS